MRKSRIKLGGGLDKATAHINTYPGALTTAVNVECKLNGGYRRILGYVAFDPDEVVGEGNILGVWSYQGEVYAARNDVGGATATMWRSSGTGWTAIKTGLAPNGKYEFVNYSFAGTEKMYGVSGTHKAFEWDGTTWTDITTGMADDTPNHLTAHRKHLFLSFDNSVQFSALGDPLVWTLQTGAGEISLGYRVTGFAKLVGGVLAIFTEKSISTLSGSSAVDWSAEDLSEFGSNAGAVSGSIQQMGTSVRFMDVRGVTDFVASQKFGDFEDAVLSRAIDPLIEGRASSVTTSTVIREKNQYRIFFNDGTGFIFVFAPEGLVGITRTRFPDPVLCSCNGETSIGEERVYFGSNSGYVFQMERGNSFNGNKLLAVFDTAYTNLELPTQIKRFRRLRTDMQSSGMVSINMRADYRLGASGLPRKDIELLTADDETVQIIDPNAPFGQSAILGTTILGGSPISEGEVSIEGRGEWVSFRFYSNSASDPVWEMDGLTVEYLLGRHRR